MVWTQIYAPVANSILVSALVAAIPIILLLGALAFFHIKAHWAAVLGLVSAWAVAVFVYGMPAGMATMSAVNGALFGLLPIGWIILNAIFVYDITVKTGKFEVVKDTIAGIAADRRIQVLLIGFAFGAFIEGAAGFGTPVAIWAGIPYTNTATAQAESRPRSAAQWAFTWKKASAPRRRMTGMAATSAETNRLPATGA